MEFNTNKTAKKILGGTLLAAVTTFTATAPAEAMNLLQTVNNVYEYNGQSYDAQIVEGSFREIFNSDYRDGLLQFTGNHHSAVGGANALSAWAADNDYNMAETFESWDGGNHWLAPVTVWSYTSSHWQGKIGTDWNKNNNPDNYLWTGGSSLFNNTRRYRNKYRRALT